MSLPPIEEVASRRIGSIEYVSPNEIAVLLDLEAPEAVAMNTGTPQPFPRVLGYVLIPSEGGMIVGQVEWLRIERSPFPKRKGFSDFGLVDLPYPLRKMNLNPLGILRNDGSDRLVFRRGVNTFPAIGDPVLLPTEIQLRSIVESGEARRVKIGTSPLAGNADIYVDPDRLFGRHLAVLGNTGSGKSCSVAGLLQWSLDAAAKEIGKADARPNARFIILDPNGEYSHVFASEDFKHKARIFRVDDSTLQVPLWFWNSAEWCSFTQASAKAQFPLLKRALREIRAGRTAMSADEQKLELRRYLSSNFISITNDVRSGSIRDDATKFGTKVKAVGDDLQSRALVVPSALQDITTIRDQIQVALSGTHKDGKDKTTGKPFEYYTAFTEDSVRGILSAIEKSLSSLGGIVFQESPGEDTPIPYDGALLADHLDILSKQENVSQFLDFLIARIRTMLAGTRMKAIIGDTGTITLDGWLSKYIGDDSAQNGCLTVVDLSLVPSEITHLLTAVIARVTLEALQRYKKLEGKVLPTVLVMEEAHNFIARYKEDVENPDTAAICCRAFEKIAREGRKFGLGLVLSSQRPSELSQTVLSQCNTFLLHRISNDRDQEQVSKLVPDNLRGLLRELPSLPSQYAILLGWASELPVLVRMNDLSDKQQPHSKDPDFWDVWRMKDSEGKECPRSVNWKKVADDWQKGAVEEASNECGPGDDRADGGEDSGQAGGDLGGGSSQ